ncbi:MAG: HU family DNA-binding protein [Sulfuricella sp.]
MYTVYHRVTGAPSCSESKLAKEISAATQLSEGATKRAIDAFKGTMKVALKKGDMASLTGFGCFYVGTRAARNGRNPQTGETILIRAAKVPHFRASKTGNRGGKFSPASALKDAVN